MNKRLILCDCLGSQQIDRAGLETATGLACSRVHKNLCGDEIAAAADAITAGDCIICCAQEQPRFEELATEIDGQAPEFLDLRDRAGWGGKGSPKLAKMSALIAEAMLPAATEKTTDVVSDGMCLIIGAAEHAYAAAEQLSGVLNVTVLLADDADPPDSRDFDVIHGTLTSAQGAFGGFQLGIDNLRQVVTGGRGDLQFGPPRDGGRSACDVILDLSGGAALFPAPQKREGYLRADPKSQSAVAAAVFQAAQLVGIFEKTLFVRHNAPLCAHSRAGKIGCSKCLDVCPTGAIQSDGDHVRVDPMICAGCGSCAALCPSGAMVYEAPELSNTLKRLEILAKTYSRLADHAPRLLVHDGSFGAEMIALAARHDRGLPADVIPMAVATVSGFGHAEMLAALGVGFSAVDILLAPTTERTALDSELELATALAGGSTVRLLEPADPTGLCDLLYGAKPAARISDNSILPIGTRRQVARLAASALNPDTTVLVLPDAAPYGTVAIDGDACTLCLSCAALCPTGALADNPDLPQLRFQEDACLQCGICVAICPEKAITLQPQLNLAPDALSQQVLRQEEPFACIECGALFASGSTIERISASLAGKHQMFGDEDAARIIRMCEDCRVEAQFRRKDSPLSGQDRPKVRTTDDYFSKRKDH